ncbi:MAG: MerR family transcriptional regulator, partial [Acutalibacteraceae bacterium]
MEYTIKQLANLSGVSTRTLRYYDEIDLLKPKRIGENGYRIYETEQIDTLEQILCYRSLGVSLEEISRLLSATNTEKEQVLQRHLIALSERKSQIELFIENVSKTILLLKGDIIMTDEEK